MSMFWQSQVQMTTTFICFKQHEGSTLPRPPPTLVSSNAEVLHPLPPPLHPFRATRRFCTFTTSTYIRFVPHPHHLSTCFEQREASAHSTTSAWGFWNLQPPPQPTLVLVSSNAEVLHPPPPPPPRLRVG